MRGYWPARTDDTTGSSDYLVDEYRLFVYPVVVGGEQRLFQDSRLTRLELLESTTFRSGVVLQRYRPR